MRIISGTCKGKKLSRLSGKDIRPTSDRAREALFSIISQKIEGAVVLDLFAGTGALGFEALSRGAEYAFFIDISEESCSVIKKNRDLCKFHGKAAIICHDISKQVIPPMLKGKKIDLIFMDPPYCTGLLAKALADPDLKDLMGETSLVIAEHSVKEKIPEPISGLDIKDQRKYSKSLITFFTKK